MHAKKDVPPDAVGQPVMDRTDLKIDGLDAAKGAFGWDRDLWLRKAAAS